MNQASAVIDVSASPSAVSALTNAVGSLSRQRHRSGTFPYQDKRANQKPESPNVQAAAGRMPLCEAALFVRDKSSVERLQTAIEASFKHHGDLDAAYKYDNHTDCLLYTSDAADE